VFHDRRVKLVVLTAKGQQVRAGLLREFHRPPPELAALGRKDRADRRKAHGHVRAHRAVDMREVAEPLG